MLLRKVSAAAAAAIAAACMSLQFAEAGVNSMTSIGPEGGSVNKIGFHPTKPSLAFLAAYAGFHRSEDAGQSWSLASGDPSRFVVDFAVDVRAPNRIYLAGSLSGLLVSDDDGQSFTRLTSSPVTFPETIVNVEVAADGTVYVSTYSQLFRSHDRGASWQQRTGFNGLGAADFLVVDPANSNHLYYLLGEQGFRSLDGGGSWTSVSTPSTVNDVALAPGSPQLLYAATNDGVYVSDDQGQSWDPTAFRSHAYVVRVDPTNPAAVYAGSSSLGLVRSVNGGASWQSVHGNARTGDITSVAINPASVATILMTGSEGVALTTDGGDSWIRANRGFVGSTIDKFVTSHASRRVYLNSEGQGVFVLEAGAQQVRDLNAVGLAQQSTSHRSLLTWDVVAAGPHPDRLIVAMNGGYGSSEDGGDTWTWTYSTNYGAIGALTSEPSRPGFLLNSTVGGIRSSTDWGTTWVNGRGLPERAESKHIAISPSAPSVAFASMIQGPETSGPFVFMGVYKSNNSGADWFASSNGIPAGTYVHQIAVDPRTEQTAYAATESGLFKTTDGGGSWNILAVPVASASSAGVGSIAIDDADPDVIYASGARLARSIDGGVTWQDLSEGIADIEPGRVAVYPFERHTLLVARYGRGVYRGTIASDLSVTAAGPSQSTVGATGVHAFTVSNTGPFHLTNVRSSVQFPASARVLGASVGSGTCTIVTTVVTCTQRSLKAGDSAQITVSAAFDTTGDAEVVLSATSSELDTTMSNNTALARVDVVAAQAPVANGGGSGVGGGSGNAGGASGNAGGASSGTGGGGGALSWYLLVAMLMLAVRQQVRPRRLHSNRIEDIAEVVRTERSLWASPSAAPQVGTGHSGPTFVPRD